MKSKSTHLIGVVLILLICNICRAQSIGISASAVWLSDCNQSNFFNTSGSNPDLIGPSGNTFSSTDLGVHTQNSGTLIFRGAQLKTFKNPASSNVCAANLHYRVYLQSGAPGVFTSISLPLLESCTAGSYPSGGTCADGDQKWERVIADGETTPYSPINLTGYAPGNYYLEVYYDITGSNSSTSLCNETVTLNNGGAYYRAAFTIQSPTTLSINPSSCGGNQGSITLGGLKPGATYQLTYSDDGTTVGPNPYVANASGQIIITGLNKGFYSNFSLEINGCTTNLFTGIILSDPIFVPQFASIPPFCAGTTPQLLPTNSINGIGGTWSPAIINNQASGTYTFTPNGSNQCAIAVNLNVTVIQRTTPTFPFGTSLIICTNGTVPTLPPSSQNGYAGTWSPSTLSNQNSGTYTFTPNANLCANQTTFTVTVNPNITPTFSFGTSLTICEGDNVPSLPATSVNSIAGTWSPATVSNQNSGTYTFTPTAGQCAVPTAFTVTVTQKITPTFSFGTSSTICSGDNVPTLPATSDNNIPGTWSPATVSNVTSGTYTFTPATGQCALPATFTVTVTQKITPSFFFGLSRTICAGENVPALTTISLNGISGTWNPATVSNQNSGTYTFTPDPGQCALPANFSVTVNPNITPAFTFGTSLTICENENVPTLITTSTNGITGTWSPATVSNQNSATYTFTPTAGLCALPATFTVTVNPNITPAFNAVAPICSGATLNPLPTTSTNGITGSWSPALNNTATTTYTFTPTAGQCALPKTLTITVNQNITPSFTAVAPICSGATLNPLPTTSNNGITGTWSPALNNTATTTYTFTPDAGQCALTTTLTITVNPNITPSFTAVAPICSGATLNPLPTTSNNGITGTWSPALNNTGTTTYTFTPDAGQCALTTTLTITVNPNITPAFNAVAPICSGGTLAPLPTTSNNGITGTWSPALNNTTTTTYTFTPTAGQCALTTTLTITVNTNITPSFTAVAPICSRATLNPLPTTSNNGITGTWSPALNNTATTTYTFTPTAGQCALITTLTITVNTNITPSFTAVAPICSGATLNPLPTTSNNVITGSWSPSLNNTATTTYTFTPDAGQCALITTLTITVNQNVTPVFNVASPLTICAGSAAPGLPTTSNNGITGTWSPATIDNQNSGTYTFTANPGQCVTTSTIVLSVTVTPTITPVFSIGNSLSICNGGTVPTLPGISTNGITGTWNPAIVSNQSSGTYTFTPTSGGSCVNSVTYTVTVNAIVTPTFSFGTSQSVCRGANAPALPLTSTNGIAGTWSPTIVDNQNTATYTFTPDAGQCASGTTFTYEVNDIPVLAARADTTVYDGDEVPEFNFISTPPSTVNWTNNTTSIGLGASGTGKVPYFNAVNMTNAPVTATITATPRINGCAGDAQSYKIIVLPLDKDVFVPNVFSPNGDGKNDLLFVYGNYIDKVDMRIFNQWGQQIFTISNKSTGWDGRANGAPQPVGVYVYSLKATLTNGKQVNLKGSITLVR